MRVFEQLNRYRANIWINDVPKIKYKPNEQKTLSFKANNNAIIEKAEIAVELSLAPYHASSYVFLGLRYTPSEDKLLKVIIDVSQSDGETFVSPMKVQNYKAHIGIPGEYIPAVIETVKSFFDNSGMIPSGLILFHTGAHDEAGSSPWIFGAATKILLNILTLDPKRTLSDEMESLIKEYTRRPGLQETKS